MIALKFELLDDTSFEIVNERLSKIQKEGTQIVR